jgi:hypothetical protein
MIAAARLLHMSAKIAPFGKFAFAWRAIIIQ